MDVVIVSKTQMSNAICVGGILENGRSVRLLDEHGHNQPIGTPLNVGDIYTITFKDRNNLTPPHLEDILILSQVYKTKFENQDTLVGHILGKLRAPIWVGSSEKLFDEMLQWTDSGSGYISEKNGIPDRSTGFWIANADLIRHDYKEKVRYNYPPVQWRSLSFVGLQTPVDRIQAGTLLRVSLARWWSPDEETEKRCYLQLSGWYESPIAKAYQVFDDAKNLFKL